MSSVILIVFLIFACLSKCVFSDDCKTVKAFKVFTNGQREIDFLHKLTRNSLELQVTIQRPAKRLNSSFIFTAPDCQQQRLLSLMRKHEIFDYEIFSPTFEPKSNLQRSAFPFNPLTITQHYLSHAEADNYIEELAAQIEKINPKISVKVKVEAVTFERREVKSITIQYRGKKSNPVIIMEAGMHAREWHSRSMALYFLKKMSDEAALDVKGLIYKASFVIIPGMNPDGYEYSRYGNKMWRKNRTPVGGQCFGVDQNRNFDVHWNEGEREHRPCDEVYGGPKAFSETETQGIKNILQRWKGQTKLYVSIHTYGNTIIYPYGYTKKPHPNRALLQRVAMAGVSAVYNETKTIFSADQSGSSLYVAPGGSDDYAIDFGVPFSYTFELGPEAFGFAVPEEKILQTVNDGFIGLKAMIIEALKI